MEQSCRDRQRSVTAVTHSGEKASAVRGHEAKTEEGASDVHDR